MNLNPRPAESGVIDLSTRVWPDIGIPGFPSALQELGQTVSLQEFKAVLVAGPGLHYMRLGCGAEVLRHSPSIERIPVAKQEYVLRGLIGGAGPEDAEDIGIHQPRLRM
jgi:hypothetical protein